MIRRKAFPTIVLFLLMGGAGLGVFAVPEADTLIQRLADTWGPLEVSLTATMTTVKPGRNAVETEIRILRGGPNRTRIEFLAPEKDAGKVILRLGDKTWLYLPKADRRVKVPARRNPLAGGVMFEDLFPGLPETDDASVTATEEGFVLTGKTNRIYFHRTSLVPFRREYYSRSGRLLKTIHIDEIRDWKGVPIPWKIRFVDHLKNGVEATITIRSAVELKDSDKRLFSKDAL